MKTDTQARRQPYPPSPVIEGITWHWETHHTAAPGSDLWPVTWAADDCLYTAWGDGGGFGGTDADGRVALGFARIEGSPERFVAVNVNGGKNPEHPASFAAKGKTGGMLSVRGTLYAWVNLENGAWPDVDQALAWSGDRAATWQHSEWVFPKGPGNFKPATFLNFGKEFSGVPDAVKGYVYLYGQKQGDAMDTYLGRVRVDKIRERGAYQFLSGITNTQPVWSSDPDRLSPAFVDYNGTGDLASVVYMPRLKRYLLTSFHKGPGQLGVFDAPEPWGPWTTVAYYEEWGQMGVQGQGLTCTFPPKWVSADGLTVWCVFSVYGEGAKQGIQAHDRFNLVKVTLRRRKAKRLDPAA